jgi:hemerythrin-like metal-binding protein
MSYLIDPADSRYWLGVFWMDKTHQEFIQLINELASADPHVFMLMFRQTIEHTEAHFAEEARLMKETDFPAIREHKDEHLRMLGALNRMGELVAKGRITLPRAYVREHLPTWFNLHAITMDSALAAHIRSQQATSV